VPSASEGATRRALLIEINYVGHKQGVLSGCHNDALNMVQYIKNGHAFKDEDIAICWTTASIRRKPKRISYKLTRISSRLQKLAMPSFVTILDTAER
jgi:hypothetical protein